MSPWWSETCSLFQVNNRDSFCRYGVHSVSHLLFAASGAYKFNSSAVRFSIYHRSVIHSNSNVSLSDLLSWDEERVKSLNNRITQGISNSVSIPLNSGLSIGSRNYLVRVGFGMPAKFYSLIMDTGSTLTWLQCKPCVLHCHPQVDLMFDPSASKTFKYLPCTTSQCSLLKGATHIDPTCEIKTNNCIYTAGYADKSFSSGYLSQDSLALSPSQTLSGFVYGCGQDNEGLFGKADGVIGLARNKLSMLTQLAGKFGNAFSYCFPSATSGSKGFLSFGNIPSVSYKYTPMGSDSRYSGLYFLELANISVAGMPIAAAASGYKVPTIIDSGTAITRLPMSVYSALRQAFTKIMSTKYKRAPAVSILDTCYKGSIRTMKFVPQIRLTFIGGADLTLSASNSLVTAKHNVVCLAFAGSSESTFIIGNNQQQTFKVAYDVAGSRIGFAANDQIELCPIFESSSILEYFQVVTFRNLRLLVELRGLRLLSSADHKHCLGKKMGCISSKHISKSMSFKAKLSRSFGKISYRDPDIERVKTPGNGSDQVLAFIYSANMVTTDKVQEKVRRTDSNRITPAMEFDLKQEISASVAVAEQEEDIKSLKEVVVMPTILQQTKVTEEFSIDGALHSRSKSCHSFSEHEVKIGISEWNHKGITRARSFHTVEEFDALLEKIRLSREQHVTSMAEVEVLSHVEDETKEIQATTESCSNEKVSLSLKDVPQKQDEKVIKGETKRKAIAKGLSPITVPEFLDPTPTSIIEFVSVPSLRDWVSGTDGQVYSPGSKYYTTPTPKFGSYANAPLQLASQEVKSSNNDEDDNGIINPDFMAAFEEYMRQLEAEEENIFQ
ncbi:hypothetical protein ACFE04_001714 [Oxalis oulophora]